MEPTLRRVLMRLERVLALAERWLHGQIEGPAARHTGGRGAEASAAAGDLARGVAFRWDARRGPGRLAPISEPATFDLADLIGVERAVAELVRNTEKLVRGLPAHHVLLYGERGSGKSSAVAGVLTRFAARGLRLVEVGKSDLADLPDLFALLRGRPEPSLIFCDDLSFEHGDENLRELKAALEGSLTGPPANVRLIATSNRRHVVARRISDHSGAMLDEEGELHPGEANEEKLALADRFGLTLGFFAPNRDHYLRIVDHYAQRAALDVPLEQLHREALRLALERGHRSGRLARQFVDDRVGCLALEQLARSGAGIGPQR